MSSKLPASSKVAFSVIRNIINMGVIEIPPQFNGTGAPGNTLEYLFDVKQNNLDSPDLFDWEIKFHGGNSLLTLFHKDPEPIGIMNTVVDTFGWVNKNDCISFRHTIKGQSERGFVIKNVDNKIIVTNTKYPDIQPYWAHNTILNAIVAKLRRLILIHGKVSKDKRTVVYDNAVAYWDINMSNLFNLIQDGTILIDFDARTTFGRGTSLRNHGTKFRIKIGNIAELYENSQPL